MKKIVILGHVDHGKSTLLGRLLVDTHVLPQGKLEQIRRECQQNAKPFEYAFLLDALKVEQSQGITLDLARCFFRYNNSDYLFLDAPGHIEFVKNAVTGAFQADHALVVIDIQEGIQENSRRHGFLLSLMKMEHVIVVFNKMDLVEYDQALFQKMKKEYQQFLETYGIHSSFCIPISGVLGENLTRKSSLMPWYEGPTLLQAIMNLPSPVSLEGKPFRMPVQDVYKFTENKDSRRIVVGLIESGYCRVGDTLLFLPSKKEAKIVSIEQYPIKKECTLSAGMSGGITIYPQLYVKRGEMAVKVDEKHPHTGSRIKVRLYSFASQPLQKGQKYLLKLGTVKVFCVIEKICTVLDTATFQYKHQDCIRQHDTAECVLALDEEIAFDVDVELFPTARFVLIQEHGIIGGGVISAFVPAKNKKIPQKNVKGYIRPLAFKKNQESVLDKSVQFFVFGNDDNRATFFSQQLCLFLEKKLYSPLCFEVDIDATQTEKEVLKFREMFELLGGMNTFFICVVKSAKREKIECLFNNGFEMKFAINVSSHASFDLQSDYQVTSFESLSPIFERIFSDVMGLMRGKAKMV